MKGKVAFVSGGATGIGRATARLFAEHGAAVALADLDADRGESVAQALRARGADARFYHADMTSKTAVDGLFEALVKDFGGLDYAHNNVGFSWGANFLDTSSDDFDRTVSLCMRSPFISMQQEIRLMRRRGGGSIVNTASMAGVRYTDAANAVYSAAKAAVIHLSGWVAAHHAADNIRVNAISPGLVATEAVEKFMSPEEQAAHAKSTQPIARAVSVEEIAASVIFLCSAGAAMITGENICISGGSQV
ncbi:hypothetical protein LK12_22565 [Novosphingobium malaysiense]|uniref:Short-chain dehydrogenase n=2 Tax=Novosphingobium malaysiense TaxID=1348853 RepID=A0A0B1ZF83_9SPHN|nr:hypothetical protein LK12_22565 [Novosphingobium malaysiense]